MEYQCPWKWRSRPWTKECRQTLEPGKGFFAKASRRNSALWTLGSSPRETCIVLLTYRIQSIEFSLCQAIVFLGARCSSNKKLTHLDNIFKFVVKGKEGQVCNLEYPTTCFPRNVKTCSDVVHTWSWVPSLRVSRFPSVARNKDAQCDKESNRLS